MSVLATWTRISKILLRATAEVDRFPEAERASPSSSGTKSSRWKSRLKSAIDRMNVEDDSPTPWTGGRGRTAGASSRTVRENVPTVRTSPGTIGEEATNFPLTFTPFVEFWSMTTQAPSSCRITACRRETEKSFRTISFSLDRPRKTSVPVRRKRCGRPSTS